MEPEQNLSNSVEKYTISYAELFVRQLFDIWPAEVWQIFIFTLPFFFQQR